MMSQKRFLHCTAIAALGLLPAGATADPGADHSGAPVFKNHCARCHDRPEATRARFFAELRQMNPVQVRHALTVRLTKQQGSQLSEQERDTVVGCIARLAALVPKPRFNLTRRWRVCSQLQTSCLGSTAQTTRRHLTTVAKTSMAPFTPSFNSLNNAKKPNKGAVLAEPFPGTVAQGFFLSAGFIFFISIAGAQEIHAPHCLHGCRSGSPATNDLVIRQIYILSSNDRTKFADWVAYKVTKSSIGPTQSRNWKSDPKLGDIETLEPQDYKSAHAEIGTNVATKSRQCQ